MGFRMLRSAVAVLAVLLVAGCVPGEPVITPEPDPGVTPVFASDEEALAAATEAYARYLEVSDQITAEGGANPERLEPYVTPEQWAEELAGMKEWSDSGNMSVGASTFDRVTLQQYTSDPDLYQLTVYLCVDVSAVKVLDSTGSDVTRDDRINRYPLEVGFEASAPDDVLIARSEVWLDASYCS